MPPADAPPSAPPPPRAQTATRLAPDWQLPRAWGEWALEERPDWQPEQVRKVAEAFRDHWLAKGGADARKADWQATWRNWVRREPSSSRPSVCAAPASKQAALEQRNAQVAAAWLPPELRNDQPEGVIHEAA